MISDELSARYLEMLQKTLVARGLSRLEYMLTEMASSPPHFPGERTTEEVAPPASKQLVNYLVGLESYLSFAGASRTLTMRARMTRLFDGDVRSFSVVVDDSDRSRISLDRETPVFPPSNAQTSAVEELMQRVQQLRKFIETKTDQDIIGNQTNEGGFDGAA